MRDFSLKFLSNLGRDTRPRKLKFCPVLSCPVPSRLVLAVVGQIRVSVEITNCSQNRTEQNNSKKKKKIPENYYYFLSDPIHSLVITAPIIYTKGILLGDISVISPLI